MNEYIKSYAPPPAINDNGKHLSGHHHDQELLEYIQTGLEDEKGFLRSNRAFKVAESCMSILMGDTKPKRSMGPSNLQINKSRRQAREAIANQSDIRQNWKIRTLKTEDPLMIAQADRFNDLSSNWWYTQFVDRIIKAALQLAGGHGTGYVYLWPDRDILTGEIEIIPTWLDYKQVLVGHIPKDGDLYKSYRVDIRVEYPLPTAHRKFPEHIDIIQADRGKPSWMSRTWETSKRTWKGVIDRIKNQPKKSPISADPFPTADIFWTFIMDDSVNTTGNTVCMGGDPNAHWYYEVPSYYDEDGNTNQVGTNTFFDGKEVMRYLTRDECRFYPKRRLIISSTKGIVYDGPPQWGDGMPPVVQFYFDKIAGEFLAFPVIMDTRSPGNSVDEIMRALEDQVIGKVNPPIGIDNQVPNDIKDIVKRLGARGLIGKAFNYSIAVLQKAIVPLISSDFYTVDKAAFELVKFLQELQDYLAGTNDFANAQRLKQMPAADTQEAMIQNLGVLTTDQSRDIEKAFMYLGKLWMSFAPQVYTLRKRLQVLDLSKALFPREVDFDPSKIQPITNKNDSRPAWVIAAEHLKNFSIYVSPNSVQERQSFTNKLTLLQTLKVGVPISSRKIYNTLIGDDEYDKTEEEYFAEQKRKAIAAAEIQAEVQKIIQAANPSNGNGNGQGGNPAIEELLSQLANMADNGGNNTGRPSSNTAPARIEQKTDQDGVPRTTTATNPAG